MDQANTQKDLKWLEDDYERTINTFRNAYKQSAVADAPLFLKIAQHAFDKVFFDDAREFIAYAVALDPSNPEIVNKAAWIEVQFSIARSRELLKQYLELKMPTHPTETADTVICCNGSQSERRISILVPSRKLNNNDHHLPTLIDSINHTCRLPSAVEVIIKIDSRDNADYFISQVQRLKPEFSYTLIQGHSHGGLVDLHKLYEDCFIHKSKDCQLVIPASDRMFWTRPSWDKKLLQINDKNPLCMVHLTYRYKLRASTHAQMAWLLPLSRPVGATYAVSCSLLEHIRKSMKDVHGLTHFGLDYNVSLYLAVVEYMLRTSAGMNVLHFMPGTVRTVHESANPSFSTQDRSLLMMQEYYRFLERGMIEKMNNRFTLFRQRMHESVNA